MLPLRHSLPLLAVLAGLLGFPPEARGQKTADFKRACDSMSVLMGQRTGVWGSSKVALRAVTEENDSTLQFRFTKEFSDYPWKGEDTIWFKETFRSLFPKRLSAWEVGTCFADTKSQCFSHLVTPILRANGRADADYAFRMDDPRQSGVQPLVTRVGAPEAPQGLAGRHIALWQSHGRYYEIKTQRWEWQRAPVFGTCEDLFTQSFVLPYLMPMLENAGAVVLTPRERDPQRYEIVVDNDPSFERQGDDPWERRCGRYSESGSWESGPGAGFADAKATYSGADNPFRMGSYRQVRTLAANSEKKASSVTWTADIPETGRYAVYVSYHTVAGSTNAAHYTVHHRGGSSEFIVNQQLGGGTWIYLGTFEFEAGADAGAVVLDNRTPEGHTHLRGSIVTADAVRFGGGMGKIEREETVSGLPSYLEGAMYAMQWAGMDDALIHENETDYQNDYAQRGAWVRHLSGGSAVNPKQRDGLRIPFDLSLAFHTDAGTTPNDSTVGTLAIYTLLYEGKPQLLDGGDRRQCRDFAGMVQDQVVSDVRAQWDSLWSRRQLWNRSYSEARMTGVPGMILELLSHQNFADMKSGLDPRFRFMAARSVYKAMLKFLSERYGCRYVVQPLPVHAFSAALAEESVELRWEPTEDPLEPTADPSYYLVQQRLDDGTFDSGLRISGCTATFPIKPGHLYSYRVIACNKGGASFSSEVLAVGRPSGEANKVLVVNNFTRVSAPAWFDTPTFAGFDRDLDSGVADGYDLSYCGATYNFRRQDPWLDDDCPGFGGSYTDQAGSIVPGNTFDFVAVHGRALLEAGYAFTSCSAEAFAADSLTRSGAFAIDLICGKQVTTRTGSGWAPDQFTVFPVEMQTALQSAAEAGVHLIVSGARVGTDIWSGIYGDSISRFSDDTPAAQFATSVLGYRWRSSRPTRSFTVKPFEGAVPEASKVSSKASSSEMPASIPAPLRLPGFSIGRPDRYPIDNPDGLFPAAEGAVSFLRYTDSEVDAAIAYPSPSGYAAITFGFPLEVLSNADLLTCLRTTLAWLESLRAE